MSETPEQAAQSTAEQNGPRFYGRPVERMLGFSDAVVAISITLLVIPLIELVPPAHNTHEAPAALLLGNRVLIGGFLLSFVVIWRIWTVHHRVFARTKTVDAAISRANMLWLATIAFMPFTVALIGSYGADPFVLALYVGVLLISCSALTTVALLLRRPRPGFGAPEGEVLEQLVGNAISLLLAFVLVLLLPWASFWPLLLLLADTPILAVVHGVRRRRTQAAAAAGHR